MTAVYCDEVDLPGAEGVVIGMSPGMLLTYGIVLPYLCVDGKRFEDGTNSTTVTCVGSGTWFKKGKTFSCQSKPTNVEIVVLSVMRIFHVQFSL